MLPTYKYFSAHYTFKCSNTGQLNLIIIMYILIIVYKLKSLFLDFFLYIIYIYIYSTIINGSFMNLFDILKVELLIFIQL